MIQSFDFISPKDFEEMFQLETNDQTEIPLPSTVKKHLDKYIIGQDKAKKIVSSTLVNHLHICRYNILNEDKIKKSNMMLIGNSGTGKTFILDHACKYMNIPFVNIDITEYSSTGYVGKDISDMVHMLYQKADKDIEKTQQGIIFIDEIDKISEKNSSQSGHNTTEVQYNILKLIEGGDIVLNLGTNMHPKEVTINTSNILFVFAGAFSSLIKHKHKKGIGFNTLSEKTSKDITEEDILSCGIISELLGRIGVYIQLEDLTSEQMKTILLKTENSPVKQIRKLCKLRGIKYSLTSKDYDAIIKEGMKSKLGVRGIFKELNKKAMELYYV